VKLFLGVDGGQSSTVALIADETGRVLGAGRGGPCNHAAAGEGRQKFARAMAECLRGACAQAGIDAEAAEFEAACLGFSGGGADKDAYSREFILAKAFKITHDAEIALTGATGGDPGIIVIAGTGSIAFGKNAAGQTARAGGWGYIFGDEGGAFDIVRCALRVSLAMEEGWGEATDLRRHLLAATGAGSANELMHAWYNRFHRSEVAKLAPLVGEAARGGDEAARGILEEAGRALAALVRHVHRCLFRPGQAVNVAYVGGVFESEMLADCLRRAVQDETGCRAEKPRFAPAAGALLEALRLAGLSVSLSEIPVIKS
jgi:N-acetylglucosamine kinase-like BadF-type ATPase